MPDLREKREKIVPVRVNPAELAIIDALAEAKGLTRATVLRSAALAEAKVLGIIAKA